MKSERIRVPKKLPLGLSSKIPKIRCDKCGYDLGEPANLPTTRMVSIKCPQCGTVGCY